MATLRFNVLLFIFIQYSKIGFVLFVCLSIIRDDSSFQGRAAKITYSDAHGFETLNVKFSASIIHGLHPTVSRSDVPREWAHDIYNCIFKCRCSLRLLDNPVTHKCCAGCIVLKMPGSPSNAVSITTNLPPTVSDIKKIITTNYFYL